MTDGIVPSLDTQPAIWGSDGQVALEIDSAHYSLPVALAAAYKFTNRAFVWVQSTTAANRYLVFLRPKASTDDLLQLSGAFANELIDQALRQRLNEQFTPMRTLIVAQAFSEANLLDVVAKGGETE